MLPEDKSLKELGQNKIALYKYNVHWLKVSQEQMCCTLSVMDSSFVQAYWREQSYYHLLSLLYSILS